MRMKLSPKYIEKTIKTIKEQILHYASMTNEAFDFPSGKIKTKSGDKGDLLDKYMVEFGLKGTPRTRLMWLLSTAMKELVAEGLMFKRRNTVEYKRARGSVLYFTTMFAYADSEEKLKTMSESIGEIASEYNQEQFIADVIAPLESNPDGCNSQGGFYYHKSPQPSLVGKDVIIDKDGVRGQGTYRVRVENGGVQEFTRSNVNVTSSSKETENVKESEEKSPYKYLSYYTISSLLEMLNMKGFEKFRIITQAGGYEYKDSVKLVSKRLDNTVSVGDEIYAMDFMVVVLG